MFSKEFRASDDLQHDPDAIGVERYDGVVIDDKLCIEIGEKRRLPSLGPKRVYDDKTGNLVFGDGIVLQIGKRRFRVQVRSVSNHGDTFVQIPGFLTFTETDDPETPYTEWDQLKVAERRLRDSQSSLGRNQDRDEDLYVEIAEISEMIRVGDLDHFAPHNLLSAFGQPHWIQSSWIPQYKGKAVHHLLTLNTEWGDMGNENYMVALDDDGYPEAVFFEASCC